MSRTFLNVEKTKTLCLFLYGQPTLKDRKVFYRSKIHPSISRHTSTIAKSSMWKDIRNGVTVKLPAHHSISNLCTFLFLTSFPKLPHWPKAFRPGVPWQLLRYWCAVPVWVSSSSLLNHKLKQRFQLIEYPQFWYHGWEPLAILILFCFTGFSENCAAAVKSRIC